MASRAEFQGQVFFCLTCGSATTWKGARIVRRRDGYTVLTKKIAYIALKLKDYVVWFWLSFSGQVSLLCPGFLQIPHARGVRLRVGEPSSFESRVLYLRALLGLRGSENNSDACFRVRSVLLCLCLLLAFFFFGLSVQDSEFLLCFFLHERALMYVYF